MVEPLLPSQHFRTHEQIRADLEFAITGQDLEHFSAIYQPESAWYLAFWQCIEPKLSQLPKQLQAPTRLGFYFEWLWQQALALHPDYQLLQHNLQLFDGKRTVGSLDFLIRHLPTQQVEHWELACKFYLKCNSGTQSALLGPNLNDQWPYKKRRLLQHQIQLGQHAIAQEPLARAGVAQIDRCRVIVKGKVFYPTEEAKLPQWLTLADWLRLKRAGKIQHKSDWLNKLYCSEKSIEENTEVEKSLMLLSSNQQYMLVPDNWQKKATELILKGSV